MPISHKIISAESQPNGGNGMISIAGARGLGSSGTLITELSSNNRFSPFPPYTAAQLDLSTTNLDANIVTDLMIPTTIMVVVLTVVHPTNNWGLLWLSRYLVLYLTHIIVP